MVEVVLLLGISLAEFDVGWSHEDGVLLFGVSMWLIESDGLRSTLGTSAEAISFLFFSWLEFCKFGMELSVFAEDEWTTVKYKEEDTESKACNGEDIKALLISVCAGNGATDEWRDEVCESKDEAVGIVDLVIELGIKCFILSLDNLEVNLKSLQHLRNDRDKHKDLEDTNKCEPNADSHK